LARHIPAITPTAEGKFWSELLRSVFSETKQKRLTKFTRKMRLAITNVALDLSVMSEKHRPLHHRLDKSLSA